MRRLVATLSGLALALSGAGATARELPNYEALQDAKPAGRIAAGIKSRDVNTAVKGRVAHVDAKSGQPTFVWANKQDAKARAQYANMSPEQAGLVQLREHVPLYGLSSLEKAGARVAAVSSDSAGTKVLTVAQDVNGVEVFRQNLKVLLDRNNELVATSGSLSSQVSADMPASKLRFKLSDAQAISIAYRDLTGSALDATLLMRSSLKRDTGKYAHYELAPYARPLEQGLRIPARAKQVLYPMPNGLVPGYYLELRTGTADSKSSDYYAYVVSAVDGTLLMRNNLAAHVAFKYRVFADDEHPYTPHDGPAGNNATPHPDGEPSGWIPEFRPPNVVSLQNLTFSQNDPWLPETATATSGNNVDAYADLHGPDGFGEGDLRPSVTEALTFDHLWRPAFAPDLDEQQIHAATTNLFFVNNWLHDWFYDSGFDEKAGNAQVSNYGRGGEEHDPVLAEAQDNSGINNANMFTPADGASPVMQMYIFAGPAGERYLEVTAPEGAAGRYEAAIAPGMGQRSFDTTGEVVLALDAANSAGSSTNDACTQITNAAEVAGKIALVSRGTCAFDIKVANAAAAGASGLIITNNQTAAIFDLSNYLAGIDFPILFISQADGARLRSNLPATARMFREAAPYLDGTVDNVIVAHEWGHYMSNRLVQNAAGLVNNQGRSMGEGWADFTALLMITRPGDASLPYNANWNGAFGAAEYATRGMSEDSAFFGIRRVTYSADKTKNALSFRHIEDGVALPAPEVAPISPSGPNSEVHNAGEVWATMLWDCYVSLLRAHPFGEAQERMKRYLANGYKMTPALPTFLEARDAIIAAAYAADPADGQRFWSAFAGRGAGVGAVAPDRYSTTHAGVVESDRASAADVELVSVTFEDSTVAAEAGDRDGILDNGETGRLHIKVRNAGSLPASDTSVTALSLTDGVTVGNGGAARFADPIPVAGESVITLPVSLRGAEFAQTAEFVVALRDGAQVVPGDKRGQLSIKVHYDEVHQSTPVETVEVREKSLPWTQEHATAGLADAKFEIIEWEDGTHSFFGPNMGAPADFRLVSPAIQVSETEPFILTLRHAYAFEAGDVGGGEIGFFDGAVIELTEDNGQTWVDIGSPLYGGTLYDDPEGYANNRNPLKGQPALVGFTENFPELITETLDLGTAYAGKTVKIRFRVVSDNGAADTGWVLDDIGVSGVAAPPFSRICEQGGVCENTAPVASAGADFPVEERSEDVEISGNGYDVDGDPVTFEWTRVSGPNVTLNGANTATVSFDAPEVTADSNLVLRLTVTDDNEGVTQDTVTVRILNVNRAPTVNAGMDATVGERSVATLTASASDADSDNLTFLWTQVSGPQVALSGYTTSTVSFSAPEVIAAETLSFRLTVTDGKLSTSDTVNVMVNPVNRAPVVMASSVTVDERSTATLTASATDPDGDAVTYAWTQVDGTTVELSGANTATATFNAAEVSADEVLTFRVAVNDGTATTTQEVTVNVRHVNVAPTVNAGLDGTVDERASFTLSGSASDADGDDLTYQWTQVAGPRVTLTNANSAQATFTAPETVSGETLSFVLTVNDGQASTSDAVDVVVGAVNRAPVARASAAVSGNQTSITLDGSGSSDPDGDTLTYRWEQTGGPAVTLSNADKAVLSVDVPEMDEESATFTFRLTVTDAHGGTHNASVSATAKPDRGGGCSSTGAGAPAGMIGLALLALLKRRRRMN